MSIGREGSRDTAKGIIVSIYPDVCLAKKDPVPFSIYAIQGEDANTAPTVRMTGQRAHNAGSLTTCCHGDEPGLAGVVSGTVGAVCEPKTWSPTVNIEGKPAVRHGDEWWMNCRNTTGKLCWIESPDKDTAPKPILLAQAATGTMTDAAPIGAGTAGGKATPGGRIGLGGKNIAAEIANMLTGGLVHQRQVEFYINDLQAVLDAPSTPPLTAGQRQILESAIADIRAVDLPAGNVEAAQEKHDKAIEQVVASAAAGVTAGNVRVTSQTRSECDELCHLACECMRDRGGDRTYTDCVSRKLREKYYNQDGPRMPDGSPRRPTSPTADGPRPEVSYKPGTDGRYQPVASRNDPDMHSSQIPIPGAPRPDVSWWKDGKLWKIFELKFPRPGGGVDTDTEMQAKGEYERIARDQGLDPDEDVIKIDVKEDCECTSEGGQAKPGRC